ncbi:MAG: nucleotidyltransferase domain-containing protein [bacterium]
MISKKLITEIKEKLVSVYDPLEIYLFGSYVWGNPDEESDLDFLIVVSESNEKSYKRAIPASYALKKILAPVDIIVYTKEEFDYKLKQKSTLCFKIQNDGKKLYARS